MIEQSVRNIGTPSSTFFTIVSKKLQINTIVLLYYMLFVLYFQYFFFKNVKFFLLFFTMPQACYQTYSFRYSFIDIQLFSLSNLHDLFVSFFT